MDYQQLKYFLAASGTLNMTSAAAQQHVSEQALSRAIRKLESELGCALFLREPRGLAITERGAELQAEAAAYVALHESIAARFGETDDSPAGKLSIAVSTGTLAQWFPPSFITDYVLQRPGLDFEMRCFSEDSHGRPRETDAYDLVFSTSNSMGEGWEVKTSARRGIAILMSEKHPLARLSHLRLEDLSGYTLAWSIEETPVQAEMSDRLTKAGCRLKIRFGPAEIPFVIDLLRAGRIVATYGGEPDNAPPGCVLREVEGLDLYWSLFVLARKGVKPSVEAAGLIELVKSTLASQAGKDRVTRGRHKE